MFLMAAGAACTGEELAPSPDALTGQWSTPPEALSPTGQIERPPTDPVIELTPSRLTLRHMVNPGESCALQGLTNHGTGLARGHDGYRTVAIATDRRLPHIGSAAADL